MRRWSEVAERVAATTRTSEKTRLLADELRTLPPDDLPIAAVFLAGRPFAEVDGRSTGLGWATIAVGRHRAWPACRPARSARPTTGRRTSGSPSPTSSVGRTGPPAGRRGPAGARRRRGGLRRDRGRLGSGRQGRPVRRAARPVRPADRQVRRQDPVGRAPDRAPRGPPRGGHRSRLRPPDRGGQARGDAHRRHRRDGRRSPGTTPSATASLRLFHPFKFMLASPAEDADRDHDPARPDRLGRGQVRRDPRPAPSRGRRGPPVQPRPP